MLLVLKREWVKANFSNVSTCMPYINIDYHAWTESTFSSVSQLVQHYQEKQRQERTSKTKPPSSSSKANPGREVSAKMFSVAIINLSILPEVIFIAIAAQFCRVRKNRKVWLKDGTSWKGTNTMQASLTRTHKLGSYNEGWTGTWDWKLYTSFKLFILALLSLILAYKTKKHLPADEKYWKHHESAVVNLTSLITFFLSSAFKIVTILLQQNRTYNGILHNS